MKKIIFIIIGLSLSVNSATVDTNVLMTLNLDQMNSMVRNHIRKSEEIAIKSQEDGTEKKYEGDVLYELKKAALLVLARPNRDNMISKLLPDIEKQLNAYTAYYPTLTSLAKEATQIIADKEAPIKVKSAYYYVLENVLAEVKPQVKKKDAGAVKVFTTIAQAKVVIPKKLSQFRILDKMEDGDFDPSGYAQKTLDKYIQGKKTKKSWWKFW